MRPVFTIHHGADSQELEIACDHAVTRTRIAGDSRDELVVHLVAACAQRPCGCFPDRITERWDSLAAALADHATPGGIAAAWVPPTERGEAAVRRLALAAVRCHGCDPAVSLCLAPDAPTQAFARHQVACRSAHHEPPSLA